MLLGQVALLVLLSNAPGTEAASQRVAFQLDYASGVSSSDVLEFSKALRRAVESRTGLDVVADAGKPCGRTPSCVTAVLARTRSQRVVFLKLLGVPTRIRLLAEQHRVGHPSVSVSRDLPRSPKPGRSLWRGVAELLFPNTVLAPPKVRPPPPPTAHVTPQDIPKAPQREISWAPWVLFGVGLAMTGAGVGFGVSSRGARSSAANEPHTAEELENLEDRAIGHGLAANILWGTAGASVLAGGLWLIFED